MYFFKLIFPKKGRYKNTPRYGVEEAFQYRFLKGRKGNVVI
jgi:hypothetical protein